jgi:hypothetical protein
MADYRVCTTAGWHDGTVLAADLLAEDGVTVVLPAGELDPARWTRRIALEGATGDGTYVSLDTPPTLAEYTAKAAAILAVLTDPTLREMRCMAEVYYGPEVGCPDGLLVDAVVGR